MPYVLRKTLQFFLTIFLVTLIVFVLFSVIPGDSARLILGPNASTDQVDALREELGLNLPLGQRYLSWISGFITGNPGNSVRFGQPVAELIGDRLPVTLTLSGLALCITVLLSIPIGIVSAKKPGGVTDQILSVCVHVFMALPGFVVGLLLTLLLGSVFSVFVVGSFVPFGDNPWLFIGSLLVPALAAALPKVAMTAKFVRASCIEESRKDYVRTAKSRGLSDAQVMRRHILPNALLPCLTVLAMTAAELLGGSLIVEETFNLPGLSRLLLQGVSSRDFPLVQGIVVYSAVLVIFLHFATDMVHSKLDPRGFSNT